MKNQSPGGTAIPRSAAQRREPLSNSSVAHDGLEATRKERGNALFEAYADKIHYDAKHDVWLVPSQSAATSLYEVTLGLRPSCECRDHDFKGHRERCKHIEAARLVQVARTREDLRIEYPLAEELLAACEYALAWFETWERHADHEHAFGGERAVIKKLRRAILLSWEEA
jgi:hypothetical protein